MPHPGDTDRDRHRPKPLGVLVRREARRLLSDAWDSLTLRLSAVARASYVHPRARLVAAGNIRLGRHCQVYSNATVAGRSARSPGVSIGAYGIIREHAYVD